MAKRVSGGSGKGHSRSASTSKKRKAPAKAQDTSARQGDGGRGPFYALVILVLAVVVVVLVNRQYFDGGFHALKKKTGTSPETAKKVETGSVAKKDEISRPDEKKKAEAAKKEKNVVIAPPEREVRVYFLRLDEKTENITLLPVRRKVQDDQPVLGAIRELIKGPAPKERQAGVLTAIPQRLAIRSIIIKNGIAVIDFNEAIEENAAGSIIRHRVDQILYTATQFEDIHGIIIQVNGRTARYLGSDGLALSVPLTREHR
jgi:spore germination protein GerM